MSRRIAISRDFRAIVVAAGIQCLALREMRADGLLDTKVSYYSEEQNRVNVWTGSFHAEQTLSSRLSLKLDGVYDVITGASPTGAPPTQRTRTVTVTDTIAGGVTQAAPVTTFTVVSGPSGRSTVTSTTVSVPTASSAAKTVQRQVLVPFGSPYLPMATFSDKRYALNGELTLDAGGGLFTSGQFAYSTESDYEAVAATLKVVKEFNQKNTVVTAAASYNHDRVMRLFTDFGSEKHGWQYLLGVSQVLGPKTVINADLTLGFTGGYLSDPYKLAEVNGTLLFDNRPHDKDSQVGQVSMVHAFDAVHGNVEATYRYYHDSFGVDAHTGTLAWYQKLGPYFTLCPIIRYYQQSAADFYAVQFTGNPEFYSADYRLSKLYSISYGAKLIWTPRENFSADVAYDRYEMRGMDNVTSSEAYPLANVVTFGFHLGW